MFYFNTRSERGGYTMKVTGTVESTFIVAHPEQIGLIHKNIDIRGITVSGICLANTPAYQRRAVRSISAYCVLAGGEEGYVEWVIGDLLEICRCKAG